MRDPRSGAAIAIIVFFRAMGALLLIVSAIHFAVTSTLMHSVVDGHVDAAAERIVRASFLLNHLVVGVLLAPVGLSTVFAAAGIVRGDVLARRIGWANALAVAALPGVIAAVMGSGEILSGSPFTVAVGLVVLAALAMVAGMWLTRPSRTAFGPFDVEGPHR